MAKYIMIYRLAQPFDMAQLPKDKIVQAMSEWGEWVGRIGSVVVDRGDAFKIGGKTTDGKEVNMTDNLTSGYSVVEAKDFDEALSYAQDCPVIKNGGRVEIYEAFGTDTIR